MLFSKVLLLLADDIYTICAAHLTDLPGVAKKTSNFLLFLNNSKINRF